MNEQEKFLAELPSDGQSPYEEPKVEKEQEEKETPAVSPAESKPEEKAQPSQEGENIPDENNLPFHKHPRWKALQEERKTDRQLIESLQQKLNEVQPKVQATSALPQWFVNMYGEDQALFQQFQQQETERINAIKESVVKEIEAKEKAKVEAQSKWEKWVDDQIGTLVEEGKKFDKNELFAVLNQYRPTDEQGNLDFRKGYELLELKHSSKPTSNPSKQVAAKTAPSNGSVSSTKGIPIEQLRRKSIYDLANEPL